MHIKTKQKIQKMLTQEKINRLKPIKDYGRFIHRITEKLYLSPTENLLKIEFEHKKSLAEIPKEVEIECVELLESGLRDTSKISIALSNLKMITSITHKDADEIFYVEE